MDAATKLSRAAALVKSFHDETGAYARAGTFPRLVGGAGWTGPQGRDLPCLNSNNSTEQTAGEAEKDARITLAKQLGERGFERFMGILDSSREMGLDGREVSAKVSAELVKGKAARHTKQGRTIIETPDGQKVCVGGLSTSEKKTAFCLRENVKALAGRYGLANLGFLTLTFADAVTDTKEAQRRFNSLATHFLRSRFKAWIVVVEPQGHRGGVVHYHLLVVCGQDIRTGFDFEAVQRRDYSSANAFLKSTWATLRHTLPGFGFGRSELLPIKSTEEGIARYVGKYLSKGTGDRLEGWERARLVRYSAASTWRQSFVNFAWNSNGAKLWRSVLRDVALHCGATEEKGMARKFGARWAWQIMEQVELARADGRIPDPAKIADVLKWNQLQRRVNRWHVFTPFPPPKDAQHPCAGWAGLRKPRQ